MTQQTQAQGDKQTEELGDKQTEAQADEQTQPIETASATRADSTDSNDDPMADFLKMHKSLARKDAKRKAKRMRKLTRQRMRSEIRGQTSAPLKPEGPGFVEVHDDSSREQEGT